MLVTNCPDCNEDAFNAGWEVNYTFSEDTGQTARSEYRCNCCGYAYETGEWEKV